MKTFIIINGKEVRTIKAETMEDAVTRAENTCDHSKEIIVREIDSHYELNKFPNGFTDWIETHFEIVSEITSNIDTYEGKVKEIYETQGRGGIYELAEELTNEFEQQFQGQEWDGEYFEALAGFLSEKLKK